MLATQNEASPMHVPTMNASAAASNNAGTKSTAFPQSKGNSGRMMKYIANHIGLTIAAAVSFDARSPDAETQIGLMGRIKWGGEPPEPDQRPPLVISDRPGRVGDDHEDDVIHDYVATLESTYFSVARHRPPHRHVEQRIDYLP